LASLVFPGSFSLNLSTILFDKGKPVERRGRKAMGLPSRSLRGQDSQAAEYKSTGLCGCLSAFITKETTMLNTNTAKATRNTTLLVTFFISLFYNPLSTQALGNVVTLPSLTDFSKSVQNGNAEVLRGAYVADVLALPILQQPAGNAGYVSNNDGEITQFGMPSQYGNIGLLAHNHLSGRLFSQLAVGQEVRLVYGNGKVETFVIAQVLRYQALQPTSPYSSFRNMDRQEETLTAEQMFKRVYLGDRHVTFQTCISAYGDASWGRLFVIALPKEENIVDRADLRIR
jgi:hypothetical protein